MDQLGRSRRDFDRLTGRARSSGDGLPRLIDDVSEHDLLQVNRVISNASACNCSGDDLHRQADYPPQHRHYCPKDVWVFTKHNHTNRYESRQCSEKCAYGAEKFRPVNLSAGAIF